MADRQTDRQKYTHWKSAIFDTESNWSQLEKLPDFVSEVYKQKEICPTTQREHYQIHVKCHRQVRLSQMSGWIKHTKWIGMLGKLEIANSIKYCSKKESAVPGTYEEVHNDNYLSVQDILELLASKVESDVLIAFPSTWDITDLAQEAEYKRHQFLRSFDRLTNLIIMENPAMVNKFINPTLPRMWERWGVSFIKLARQKTSPTSLSEVPPPDSTEGCV